MIGGISGVSLNYVDGTTNPPSCSGRCAQMSAELERERSRLVESRKTNQSLEKQLAAARAENERLRNVYRDREPSGDE